jgi:hypothetical protein
VLAALDAALWAEIRAALCRIDMKTIWGRLAMRLRGADPARRARGPVLRHHREDGVGCSAISRFAGRASACRPRGREKTADGSLSYNRRVGAPRPSR